MIRIGDFFTEPFPVTVALWNGVCGKTGALSLRPGDPDLPVTLVNRLDAAEFCNALSGLLGLEKAYDKDGHRVGPGLRLPSQEEWEGASAPQGHFLWGDAEYPNGENPYAVLYAGDGISGERESEGVLVHRCGTKLPNRFGLYDMCGNVCEWTDSRDGDGYCILCGGSVHLDCVFDAGSVERVPEIFRSRETGFRLFSDTDVSIPETLFDRTEHAVRPPERPGRDLFSELDPSCEGIREVLELHGRGDDTAAVNAYLRLVSRRLVPLDLKEEWQALVDRSKMYLTGSTLSAGFWMSAEIGNWFDSGLCLVEPPFSLAAAWADTGDERYLSRFLSLSARFCRETRDQYDALPREALRGFASIPVVWYYGQGFESGNWLQKFVLSLQKILSARETFPPEQAAEISEIIAFCLGDGMDWSIKDDRRMIPNQYFHNAMSKLMVGMAFPDTRTGSFCRRTGEAQIRSALLVTALPDGSDMEQALNYNEALLTNVRRLRRMFGIHDSHVTRPAVYRLRYLTSLMKPCGGQPATGTAGEYFPPRTGPELRRADALALHEAWHRRYSDVDDTPLLCETVHFPYAGATVFRRGSDPLAGVYLWFYAPRFGKGHCSENCCAVNLAAYGMTMITNAGADHYSNRAFMPMDQWPLMEELGVYKQSGYGESSLLVDGCAQSRLERGENNNHPAWKEPIGYRFHSGTGIDYTEGLYEDTYSDGARSFRAYHRREVVFFREEGLFVLIDTVRCPGAHEASLLFHVTPDRAVTMDRDGGREILGYGKDEVFLGESRAFTRKPGHPNLDLRFFGSEFLMTDHYGETHPARGWFSASIQGRRFPKHDLEASFPFRDAGRVFTVLAPSPDEEDLLASAEFSGGELHLVTRTGGEISVTADAARTERESLVFRDVPVPSGFSWRETRDGAVPEYR